MEDVSPTLEIGLVQRCVGNRPELAGQLEVIGITTVQVANLHKNMHNVIMLNFTTFNLYLMVS